MARLWNYTSMRDWSGCSCMRIRSKGLYIYIIQVPDVPDTTRIVPHAKMVVAISGLGLKSSEQPQMFQALTRPPARLWIVKAVLLKDIGLRGSKSQANRCSPWTKSCGNPQARHLPSQNSYPPSHQLGIKDLSVGSCSYIIQWYSWYYPNPSENTNSVWFDTSQWSLEHQLGCTCLETLIYGKKDCVSRQCQKSLGLQFLFPHAIPCVCFFRSFKMLSAFGK